MIRIKMKQSSATCLPKKTRKLKRKRWFFSFSRITRIIIASLALTICSWRLKRTCSTRNIPIHGILTTLREQFFFGREISFSAVVYHEILITRVGSTEPTSADDEVKAFSSAQRRQLARVKRLEKVGNFMSAEVRSLSRQSSRIRGSNRNATNYQRAIICQLIDGGGGGEGSKYVA